MTKPIETLVGDDAARFQEAIHPHVLTVLQEEGYPLATELNDAVGGAEAARDAATDAAGTATNAAGTATAKADVATGAAGTATDAAGTATAKADVATEAAEAATNAAGTAAAKADIATGAAAAATVTAANVGASVARQPDQAAALSGTKWAKAAYRDSSALANAAGTQGEMWWAYDAGTDLTVGAVYDAFSAEITLGATATTLELRIWQVPTTDANVNAGPPQANDVLAMDASFTSLSALVSLDGATTGIPLNTAGQMMVLPFPAPLIIATGLTYKISVRAFDSSAAAVAVNVATRAVTGNPRQRISGGYRGTVAAGAFTNLSTGLVRASGMLRKVLVSSQALVSTASTTASSLSGQSQARARRRCLENDNLLLGHAALFSKAYAGTIGMTGDSLIQGQDGTATYTCVQILPNYITPSGGAVVNAAVRGTRTDQIRTAFLGRPAAEQNLGVTDGGTNQFGTYSGINIAVTNAGSGGTDGTYALVVSGGAGAGNKTVPAGTFTVVGGAIVSTTWQRGGGYTAVPAISTSNCLGLIGAVITPSMDIVGTWLADMVDIANAAGPQRIFMPGWMPNAVGFAWSQSRRGMKLLKALYGARVFDGLAFWSSRHNGSEYDLSLVRTGMLPRSISFEDSTNPTHPSDEGKGQEWAEFARMLRAISGIGAPYIHDDVVGIKASAALGSAVFSPRILGGLKGLAILDGNSADVVRTDKTSLALTRGAGVPSSITELYLQGDSVGLGRSNQARIVLLRQADDTRRQTIWRPSSGGSARIATDALTGAVDGKKMTVVVQVRLSNATDTQGIMQQDNVGGQIATLTKFGRRLSFSPHTSAGTTIGAVTSTYAVDATGAFATYFFCVDTTTGVQVIKGTCNEDPPLTAVPAADALIGHSQGLQFFMQSANLIQGSDYRFIWYAQDYLDIADPTVRAQFYNPVSGLPTDLGASGTVNGVTPLVHLFGMAGDVGLGKNYGTGGDFCPVPYINADNFGFADIAS